jgi:hypothetical protein
VTQFSQFSGKEFFLVKKRLVNGLINYAAPGGFTNSPHFNLRVSPGNLFLRIFIFIFDNCVSKVEQNTCTLQLNYLKDLPMEFVP